MKAAQERKLLLLCIFTFATVHFVSTQSCDNNAVCVATNVGFSCTCNYGYNGTASGCVKMDECLSSPCKSGENCSDSDGNYVCHCGKITAICASDAQCVTIGGTKTCQCQTGYSGNGVTCTDIDECTTPGSCDTNANCTNTPGSSICTCGSGYSGNGVFCTDVDECSVGLHNCISPFSCSNTDGSFECKCSFDASCHTDAQCVATGGISSCVCNDGYMGSGSSCTDVDECASESTNNCHRDADCSNTMGNYSCVCKQGKQCKPGGGSIVTISWAVLFLVIANVLKSM